MQRRVRVIDLTREIFEGMPMWFGHQKTFINTNQTHDQFKTTYNTHLGFEAHNLLISEHAGTHTDAVFEYDPNGPTIDKSPLEYYYGEASAWTCASFSTRTTSPRATCRPRWTPAARRSARATPSSSTPATATPPTPTWPTPRSTPGSTATRRCGLPQKGVINIGVDNVAIDHADDTEFSGHNVCGEYGIVNTEGLTNLDKVVGQRFLYFGLPLFIRNGTGSPIRAVAVFDN